jgi:hypothetical protein
MTGLAGAVLTAFLAGAFADSFHYLRSQRALLASPFIAITSRRGAASGGVRLLTILLTHLRLSGDAQCGAMCSGKTEMFRSATGKIWLVSEPLKAVGCDHAVGSTRTSMRMQYPFCCSSMKPVAISTLSRSLSLQQVEIQPNLIEVGVSLLEEIEVAHSVASTTISTSLVERRAENSSSIGEAD